MLSELYKIYRDGNISLARSIVVKSDIVIEAINKYFTMIGRPEQEDPRTWKYYLNLAGEYHWSDTPMEVLSSDTQELIPFEKNILKDHPLTRLEYKRGGQQRNRIVNAYPGQEDLIDRILDPIDIEKAIAAEEMEILYYDSILVDANELNLIPELQKWINNFALRWNVTSMGETDSLYPAIFTANLYLHMVNAISNIRVRNIKTPMASQWHVWTYLSGYFDLDIYKEDISIEQSLWLYRNIEYIRKNAGKDSVVKLMVENLVKPSGLTVNKFDAMKTEEILKDFSQYNLRVNRSDIDEPNPVLDIGSMLTPTGTMDLTKSRGLYNNTDISIDAERFEDGFLRSPVNRRRLPQYELTQRLSVLSRFANHIQLNSDYWIYLSSLGLYTGSVTIAIPGRTSVNLSPKEALILMVYCANAANGVELTEIPPLFVRNVLPVTYPSREDLSGLLSEEDVDKENVLDIFSLNRLPIRKIKGLSELGILVEEIVSQDIIHYFARDHAKTSLGISQVESAILAMLVNRECYLSTEGDTYTAWFDRMDIDLSNLEVPDLLQIAISCLKTAAGIDRNNTGLPVEQLAVLEILDLLTSYGFIVSEGRAFRTNSTIEWYSSRSSDAEIRTSYNLVTDTGGVDVIDSKVSTVNKIAVEMEGPVITDKGKHIEHADIDITTEYKLSSSNTNHAYVIANGPTVSNFHITAT